MCFHTLKLIKYAHVQNCQSLLVVHVSLGKALGPAFVSNIKAKNILIMNPTAHSDRRKAVLAVLHLINVSHCSAELTGRNQVSSRWQSTYGNWSGKPLLFVHQWLLLASLQM